MVKNPKVRAVVRAAVRAAKAGVEEGELVRRVQAAAAPTKAPGGKRAGAGRPTLFTGPRVQLGITVTERAKRLIDSTRARLAKTHGHAATDSAAVEYLIRRAGRIRMDL